MKYEEIVRSIASLGMTPQALTFPQEASHQKLSTNPQGYLRVISGAARNRPI